MSNFDEYFEKNPRELIHVSMVDFLEYAKKKYKDLDCVNGTYSDNEEEQEGEIKDYISESMEALLLYDEWIAQKSTKKS